MDVPRETSKRLASYEALLNTWSRHVNLVSRSDRDGNFGDRHLSDSLCLIDHFPAGLKRFTDLGSGGGLPAIPIAIATGLQPDMVESDRRKAAFLQTAMATLALPGKVWCERAETTQVPPSECLTARALAPLDRLLALTERLLTPTGTALFLKGQQAEEEIESAAKVWHMTVEVLPGANGRSRIVKIKHLRRSKDGFV